ncbi:MAG: site-specific integrase [Candidatus Bathyarchaeia archaeon]
MVDEKRGLQGTNIIGKIKRLKRLVKLGANLMDPESVKEVIAAQNWSDSGKETTSYVYDFFAEWMGIRWERPYYKAQRKFPFIPHEQEINDLIASCNKTVACFLQIIRETAARPGEVFNLKWIDVDLETKTLIITTVKGSPRIFKISTKLCSMLSNMPKKGERIFANHSSLKALTVFFQKQRRKASYRFGNPRMLRISFRTLRHWRATIEYARTRDILHVMEMLCHRNIKNTLIYTHLVKTESEEEYTCRVAKTVEQAAELIEAGFDYVCEINGVNSSGKENERLAGILSKGWWGSWDLNPEQRRTGISPAKSLLFL